jgi:hypothetical protein
MRPSIRAMIIMTIFCGSIASASLSKRAASSANEGLIEPTGVGADELMKYISFRLCSFQSLRVLITIFAEIKTLHPPNDRTWNTQSESSRKLPIKLQKR